MKQRGQAPLPDLFGMMVFKEKEQVRMMVF